MQNRIPPGSMKRCETCDAPLPPACPGGRCPACLMAEAIDPVETLSRESSVEATATPGDPLEGVTIGPGGRYRILQRIGEGGFGTVYMAEQAKPMRRRVALKILKAGMDTREVVARFEAERQALAMMEHPNIARVLDGGETDHGRPFFVMELVRGTPITDFCDRERLDTAARLRLFTRVCRAVQHAHQKGVIHRDLKPGNVLVTIEEGAEPVPKVIDFGVAKAIETPLTDKTLFTRFEQMVGTPAYMSPEQAAGDAATDIDTRADIYALGVLLYELLTGTTPFEAGTLQRAAFDEVRRILREEEAPRPSARLSSLQQDRRSTIARERGVEPSTLDRQLRGDLDWIVMKAIEKDRRRRYETANGLAVDIERFLGDEEVLARPPSTGYRLRKFARRHRPLLATAALVAAILVVATVVSGIAAVRAVRAERLAEQRLGIVAHERDLKVAALQSAELQRAEALWGQYAARQSKVSEALKNRAHIQLEELLAEFAPKPGEPDFRSWEWCYLRDQCRQALTTVPGTFAIWHPEEPWLTVLNRRDGAPSTIELRSASDGSLVRIVTEVPADKATSMWTMRWAGDGSRLGYLARNTATVVDAGSGEVLFEKGEEFLAPGQSGVKPFAVRAIDLSHDGRTLVTGSSAGHVQLWNVDEGSPGRVLQYADDNSNLEELRFDPTGSFIASALRWGRRTTWNVDSGDAFEYTRQSYENGRVAWSPLGTRFAATDSDSVGVYHLNQAEPAGSVPHRNVTNKPVFWLGADRLVTSGDDQTLRIWDAETLEHVGSIPMARDRTLVVGAGPEQEHIALQGIRDSKVLPVEAPRGPAVELTPQPPLQPGEFHFIDWSDDGNRITSGHQAILGPHERLTHLRIWDLPSQRLLQTRDMGIIRTLGWAATQSSVFAVSNRGELLEMDETSGSLDGLWDFADDINYSMSSISPNRRWLFLGHQDGGMCIDTATRKVIHRRVSRSPWQSRWSRDSRSVAIAHWARVHVWNPFDSTSVSKLLAARIRNLAWSPDDRLLAVALQDSRCEIVELASYESAGVLVGHNGPVLDVDWSDNGRIATASADGTVRIWDDSTGDELLVLHHPDGAKFLSVRWSPDGRRLAAGGEHGRVFVWGSGRIEARPAGARGLATGAIARASGE